jgi:hypothetical protein
MSEPTIPKLSSRWILDFEKQVQRRKHIVLYGNVHDQFLWRGDYLTAEEFLLAYFRGMAFDIVVRYDPIDGFQFAEERDQPPRKVSDKPLPPTMRGRFDELLRRGVVERNIGLSGTNSPMPNAPDREEGRGKREETASSMPTDPRTPPPRQSPAQVQSLGARRVAPETAFGDLRILMGQNTASVVAIANLGDMLTSDPGHYSLEERNMLMLLRKATLEASVIRHGPLLGYRNTLIVVAGDLKRVPEWFYFDNPFVALVQAVPPSKEERRQFAVRFLRPGPDSGGFYGGDALADTLPTTGEPSDFEEVTEEFADLTDGMKALDLEALRHTSWKERIAVRPREVWRLIDFFKFGIRDDPWEQLKPEKVRRAREELSRQVIGQPQAINAVTTMLTGARVGLSLSNSGGRGGKPKGIFFFVGPTGVGKTELAKAVTKLVFGDERAFARFDMSEYKEEHAAEKLAGAPPGFVGYEEGGQLTNRVLEQPYSILLFDEIEKAHPRVLDKFLQILEDGRLTDGKGQTAYFNQTAIIFTSNIGASDLTDPQTGTVIREGIMRRVRLDNVHEIEYAKVAAHFRTEVDWYFTSRIGRAELLNRLGDNIVVFDLLRPQFVTAIGEKFLRQLVTAAQEKYQLTLRFAPSTLEVLSTRMEEHDNLLFGGRRIKSLLESLVERPVNGWIFENVADVKTLSGRTLEIGLMPDGALEVRDV